MIKALNRLELQGKLPSPKKKYILNLKIVTIKKKAVANFILTLNHKPHKNLFSTTEFNVLSKKILYCNNTEKEVKGKMKERKKLSLFRNGMTMHMKFFLNW